MYIPVGNHIELDRELRSVRKDGQEVSVNGREALKERQYRHPNIKLKDLIKR